MLQISQTENPMCSATIDQMRLRRAMTLPFEFQNASSSGFQSEIQVGSFELMRISFSEQASAIALPGMGARSGKAPGLAITNRMIVSTASMASALTIQTSCQTITSMKFTE
ncbi:hypothetical protein GALL_438740 [mine drainage metagenome]|uniref:Uncharacterized protein n=1 Tax=mine drainage metagenome TaxID=410659 RepID=A0A1J5PUE4_9ZZZZ